MQRTHTSATGAGFTLIEILVVMAIIGMLAVMVAPNIFNQQAGARRDAVWLKSLPWAALDTYRLDVGQYPDSLEGWWKTTRPGGLEWSLSAPGSPAGSLTMIISMTATAAALCWSRTGPTASAAVRAMKRILVSSRPPRHCRPAGERGFIRWKFCCAFPHRTGQAFWRAQCRQPRCPHLQRSAAAGERLAALRPAQCGNHRSSSQRQAVRPSFRSDGADIASADEFAQKERTRSWADRWPSAEARGPLGK